jgi:YD repeat-containing protein
VVEHWYDDTSEVTRTDIDGRTVETMRRDGRKRIFTDARGLETVKEYDQWDNIIKVTHPDGSTERFTFEPGTSKLLEAVNERGIVTLYTYTDGRLTKENWPDGRFYQYTYDDNTGITERIDAKGQKARYHHDEAGRETRIEYFAAGSDTAAKTVTFTYDERGLLTGYNDGTTSAIYSYDALGRKTGETVNYGSFSLGFGYGYDAAGRKTRFTGLDGKTVTYTYDQAGQLTTINVPDAELYAHGLRVGRSPAHGPAWRRRARVGVRCPAAPGAHYGQGPGGQSGARLRLHV